MKRLLSNILHKLLAYILIVSMLLSYVTVFASEGNVISDGSVNAASEDTLDQEDKPDMGDNADLPQEDIPEPAGDIPDGDIQEEGSENPQQNPDVEEEIPEDEQGSTEGEISLPDQQNGTGAKLIQNDGEDQIDLTEEEEEAKADLLSEEGLTLEERLAAFLSNINPYHMEFFLKEEAAIRSAAAEYESLSPEEQELIAPEIIELLNLLLYNIDHVYSFVDEDCSDTDCPIHSPEGLDPEEEVTPLTLEALGIETAPSGVASSEIRAASAKALNPKTFIVNKDNESNTQSGYSDGDMNTLIFGISSKHPIEIRFDLAEDDMPTESVYLAIRAYDIGKNENTWVYVGNNKVGRLSGQPLWFGVTLIEIPLDSLRVGKNYVRIEQDWWRATAIDWVQLIIDGGAEDEDNKVGDFSANISSYSKTKSNYNISVSTALTLTGAKLYATEYMLYDTNGDYMDHAGGLIGLLSRTETKTLSMPIGSPAGTYTVMVLLKDNSDDGIIRKKIFIEFWYDGKDGNIYTELKISHSLNPPTPTRDNVEIALKAEPVVSGGATNIKYYYAGMDGKSNIDITSTGKYTVTEPGLHYFKVSYKNPTYGDKTATYTVNVTNIDRTKPGLSITEPTIKVREDGDDSISGYNQIKVTLESRMTLTDNLSITKKSLDPSPDKSYTPAGKTNGYRIEPYVDAKTPGTYPVKVIAVDEAGNEASADATIVIQASPVSISQTNPVRNGENKEFTLSAALNTVGSETIVESGFVWGITQNPTLAMNNGKAATSAIVKTKGGEIKVTAPNIVEEITYYCRAYIKDAKGDIHYSDQKSFSIGGKEYGVFSVTDAAETNNNSSYRTFTITRKEGTGGAQTVYYRTHDGSAIGGSSIGSNSHYVKKDSFVTFTEGETSKTIQVTVAANGNLTTWQNANREFYFEIYKVTGGGVIDRTTANNQAKNLAKGVIYKRDEREVPTNLYTGDNRVDSTNKDYVKVDGLNTNEIEVSSKNSWSSEQTLKINDKIASDPDYFYYNKDNHMAVKFWFRGRESSACYQQIKLFDQNGTTPYLVQFEHDGGGSANKNYWEYTFPPLGSMAGYKASGSTQKNGGTAIATLTDNNTAVNMGSATSVKFQARAAGSFGTDIWLYKDFEAWYKIIDKTGPYVRSTLFNSYTYAAGDMLYISIRLNEVVTLNGGEPSLTVQFNTGTALNLNYVSGDLTDTLCFGAKIPEGINATGVTVTGINGGGLIKDFSANAFGSVKNDSGSMKFESIQPEITPTTSGTQINHSAKLDATMSNGLSLTSLRYAWTDSESMPLTGWKDGASGKEVSASLDTGIWYLHVLATANTGITGYTSQRFEFLQTEMVLTEPTDIEEWTNFKNASITVTAINEANAQVVMTDPGGTSKPVLTSAGTKEIRIEQAGFYSFALTDNYGCKVTKELYVEKIDNTSPKISITGYAEEAIYDEVFLGLEYSDDGGSGLAKVEYAWSDSPETLTTGWTEIDISENQSEIGLPEQKTQGTWYLHARAIDNTGNVTNEYKGWYTVIAAPSGESLPIIKITGGGTQYVEKPSNSGGWERSVVIEYEIIKGSEANAQNLKYIALPGRDLKTIESTAELDGVLAASATEVRGIFTVTKNGLYQFAAMDAGGNLATKTVIVNCIDNEAPIVSFTENSAASPKGHPSVTVSAADNNTPIYSEKEIEIEIDGVTSKKWISEISEYTGSGVKELLWNYSANGTEPDGGYSAIANNTVTIGEDSGVYYIKAIDYAGNESILIINTAGMDSDLEFSCDDVEIGSAPSPEIIRNPSGSEVMYEYKPAGADDSEYGTWSAINPAVGETYTIRATSAATLTYKMAAIEKEFKVIPKQITGDISVDINGGADNNLKIGDNLTVNTDDLDTGGGTLTYEWKIGDKTIDGTDTYEIQGDDAGKGITVIITITGEGGDKQTITEEIGVVRYTIELIKTAEDDNEDDVYFGIKGTIKTYAKPNESVIITYALSKQANVASDNLTLTVANSSIASVDAAGIGRIVYTVTGDNAAAGVITINAEFSHVDLQDIDDTGINLTAQTFTYDGRPKSFIIQGAELTGFDVTYMKDGASIDNPTNSGEYDVYIYRSAKDGYNVYTNTIDGGLVIEKAESKLVIYQNDILQGEETPNPQIIVNTSGGDITYVYKSEDSAELTKWDDDATVGIYTVEATLKETANYNSSTATAEFRVMVENTNSLIPIDYNPVIMPDTDNYGYSILVVNEPANKDSDYTIEYIWKADGVAINGAGSSECVIEDSGSYLYGGKTITVTVSVTDGDEGGSTEYITSEPYIVPYKIALDIKRASSNGDKAYFSSLTEASVKSVYTGDEKTTMYAQNGNIVTIIYSLVINDETSVDCVEFTYGTQAWKAGEVRDNTSDSGSFTYTVNSADVVDGVITLTVEFIHDSLEEIGGSNVGIDISPQIFSYDGSAKSFKITGTTLTGFNISYVSGGVTVLRPANAGTYDVTVTRKKDSKYQAYEVTIIGGLTISKASNELVIECDNIFISEIPAPKIIKNTSGGKVSYKYKVKDAGGEFTETVPSTAGSYTVQAESAATANYNPQTATADFQILDKSISGEPVIVGQVKIGAVLVVDTITLEIDANTTLAYQWKADGKVVGTGASYIIKGSDAGKTITATITASGSTYQGTITTPGVQVPYRISLTLDADGKLTADDAYIEITANNDRETSASTNALTVDALSGSLIKISYTIEEAGTKKNTVTFTTYSAYQDGEIAVASADGGYVTYKVNSANAENGIITINAEFTHENLGTIDNERIVEDAQTCKYDGREKSFVVKDTDGDILSGFDISYEKADEETSHSIVKPKDAGAYNVTISRGADGEYEAFEKTINKGLTIEKVDGKLVFYMKSVESGKAVMEEDIAVVVTNSSGGDVAYEYKKQQDGDDTDDSDSPAKDVATGKLTFTEGVYIVKAVSSENNNYNEATATAMLIVTATPSEELEIPDPLIDPKPTITIYGKRPDDITLKVETQELVAELNKLINTLNKTNGDDEPEYNYEVTCEWRVDGAPVSAENDGVTYTVKEDDAGKSITVTVTVKITYDGVNIKTESVTLDPSLPADLTGTDTQGFHAPYTIEVTSRNAIAPDKVYFNIISGEEPETYTYSAYAQSGKDVVINYVLTPQEGKAVSISFAYGEIIATPVDEDSFTYTVNSADATDGVITITANFSYVDLPVGTGEIKINETPQAFTYDGTQKSFAITGSKLTGFKVSYTLGSETTETPPTKAGKYTVNVTRPADETYASFNIVIPGGLVINKASINLAVACENVTFGEEKPNPTIIATGAEGNTVSFDVESEVQFRYKQKGADDKQYVTIVPKAAGEYTVRAAWLGNDNYNSAVATANFNIVKEAGNGLEDITLDSSDLLGRTGKDKFNNPIPKRGDTLSVNTSSIILDDGSIAYQWMIDSKTVGTGQSYNVQPSDAGGEIIVKIKVNNSEKYTEKAFELTAGCVPYEVHLEIANGKEPQTEDYLYFTGKQNETLLEVEAGAVIELSYMLSSKGSKSNTISFSGARISNVTKAGTGTVSYALNLNDVTDGTVAIKAAFEYVDLADVNIDEEPQTHVYNSEAQPFVITGTPNTSFDISYAQGVLTADIPKNAGSYDVIITREKDGDYKEYATKIKNGVIIEKADNELQILCADITLGEEPKPEVIKNTSGATVSYEYKRKDAAETAYGPWSEITPMAGETYTVKAVSEATPNYKGKTVSADFNAVKKKITGEILISIEDRYGNPVDNARIGSTITADISNLSVDSGASFEYEWKIGDRTVTNNTNSYIVGSGDAGKTIIVTVNVTESGEYDNQSIQKVIGVVPYTIELEMSGKSGGDELCFEQNAMITYGQINEEISFYYTLSGTGSRTNSVIFTIGDKAIGMASQQAGGENTGSFSYRIKEDDAKGGVITVTGEFSHDSYQDINIDLSEQTYVYDGRVKSFAIKETSFSGFDIIYKKDNDEVTPVDAGTYDVYISRNADGEYKAYGETIIGGLIINKAESKLVIYQNDISVGETPAPQIIVNIPSGETPLYEYKLKEANDDAYGAWDNGAPDGTYLARAALAESNNYKETTATVEFRVIAASAESLLPDNYTPVITPGTDGDSILSVNEPSIDDDYDVEYIWVIDGEMLDSSSNPKYIISDEDGGKTIIVIVVVTDKDSHNSESIISVPYTVPYKIKLVLIENIDGDEASVSGDGIPGSSVDVSYTLNTSSDGTNSVKFYYGTSDSGIAEETKTEASGSFTYTVNRADAVNGIITLTVEFIHQGLLRIEGSDLDVDEKVQTYVYDKSLKSFSIRGTSLAGFSVTYEAGSVENTSPINAGTYNVIVTRPKDNVYDDYRKEITGGLVIEKASNTFTIACADIAIGGTVSPVIVQNTSGLSVKYEYKVNDAQSGYSDTAPAALGDYTVRATLQGEEASNYLVTSATADFSIVNKVMSGTIAIIGEIKLGAELGVDLSRLETGGAALAPQYQWKIDGVVVGTGASYTVKPSDTGKNLSVTVIASAGDYRGTFSTQAVTVPYKIVLETIGTVSGDTVYFGSPGTVETSALAGNTIRISYNLTSKGERLNEITYGEMQIANVSGAGIGNSNYVVKSEDAINGVITITVAFTHKNYEEISDTILTLTKQTYMYTGSPQEFTITSGGNLTGFTVSYLRSSEYVDPVDVGVYDVIIVRPKDNLYNAYSKKLDGALEIEKSNENVLEISCGDISFGDEILPIVVKNTSGGNISFEYYAEDNITTPLENKPTGIGTYYIKAFAAETGNYEAAESNTVNFNINKARFAFDMEITGDPYIGEVLTATIIDYIEDADTTLTYTWTVGGKKQEASSFEYTVLPGDAGKSIVVSVSASGNYSGTITSESKTAMYTVELMLTGQKNSDNAYFALANGNSLTAYAVSTNVLEISYVLINTAIVNRVTAGSASKAVSKETSNASIVSKGILNYPITSADILAAKNGVITIPVKFEHESVISNADISAVPENGKEIEDITIDDSPFFTVNAEWQVDVDDDKFEPGTVYTVIITVMPKTGAELAEDFALTVNGSPAEFVGKNTNGSITFTYTFPATPEMQITSATVITPPTLDYIEGTELDLSDLVLKITYNNDSGSAELKGYNEVKNLLICKIGENTAGTLIRKTHNGKTMELWLKQSGLSIKADSGGNSLELNIYARPTANYMVTKLTFNSATIAYTANDPNYQSTGSKVTVDIVVWNDQSKDWEDVYKDTGAGENGSEPDSDTQYTAKDLEPDTEYLYAVKVSDGDVQSVLGDDYCEYSPISFKTPKENPSSGYTVSGSITDESAPPSITVTIEHGNTIIYLVTAVQNREGLYVYDFDFKNIPNGTYNLVANNGSYKITQMITVDGKDCVVSMNMASGKTQSVIEIVGDAPKAAVSGLPELFGVEEIYGAEDMDYVDKDHTVEIKLIVELTEPNSADAIRNLASSESTDFFIDLSVFKSVYDEDGALVDQVRLENLGKLIIIVFELPNNLRGQTISTIYRIHNQNADGDNEIQALKKTVNKDGEYFEQNGNFITLNVSKFSVYALAVNNPPAPGIPETPPTQEPDTNGADDNYRDSSDNADEKKALVTINTGKENHGTVSINPKNPAPGDKVVVSVIPKYGYELDSLTITGGNNKTIAFVDNGDGTFTYIQPEGIVRLTVKFRLASANDVGSAGVGGLLSIKEHFAYVSGKGGGKFMPSEGLSRAEAAQILYNLLNNKDIAINQSFPDVPEQAWYAEAVGVLASMGIISGYPDGSFRPNESITRAQFATLLVKFTETSAGSIRFSDVTESHWAYDSINTAANLGWIAGVGNGLFEPDRNVTRAEAVTMINRMLERLPDKEFMEENAVINPFNDVLKSHWAYYEILEAAVTHNWHESGKEQQ